MPTKRGLGVEIPIDLIPNTAGPARAVTEDLSSIEKAVKQIARANGLNEESTKKVGVAMGDLVAKMQELDKAVLSKAMSEDQAKGEWVAALTELNEKVQQLKVEEAQAEENAKELARALEVELKEKARATADELKRLQRALEEDEKAMAKARAEGEKMGGMFDYVSKTNTNAGQSLRITQERAVMMGQVAGGLIAQMIAGADATQLWATGLTHLAMVLSTGGPWGMAAGAAVTILTGLVGGLMKANEEAKKAAAEGYKELQEIIAATNDELLKMDSEQHARAMEKHKRAIEDIGKSWKESLESSRRYFQEQDARADAELGLKQSELDLQKEKRLQGVTDPIERDQIEEEFREKGREAKYQSDIKKNDRQRQEAELQKQSAQLKDSEAAAQMKQLRDDIAETKREMATDRPKGVESDQRDSLHKYESALRTALEKEGEGSFKEAEAARNEAEMLRPEATKMRDIIDAGNETYSRKEISNLQAVKEYNQRNAQRESDLAKFKADFEAQQKLRDEASIASKSADARLGNIGLERDTLVNQMDRESILTQGRMDAIQERRRAYEETLTPEDRNTIELNKRLKGVADPQKRSEIELGFQQELKDNAQADALQQSRSGALKGAQGRDKATDADLLGKVGELAEATTASAQTKEETKAELQKAVEALRDGADEKELAQLATILNKTAESTDKGIQTLVKAAQEGLERAKANEDAIKRLEAQMRQR